MERDIAMHTHTPWLATDWPRFVSMKPDLWYTGSSKSRSRSMPTNDSKTSTRSLYYNTENYPLCVNIPHRSTYLKFDHRTDIYSRNLTNNLQSQKGGRTWTATRSTDCCVQQFQGESWISRAILCEITVWSRVRWTNKTHPQIQACVHASKHSTTRHWPIHENCSSNCTWNLWP